MNKQELTKQFEQMEIQAKELIDKGGSPLSFATGATNFAIEQINENKDLALWIYGKVHRVVKNIMEHKNMKGSQDETVL